MNFRTMNRLMDALERYAFDRLGIRDPIAYADLFDEILDRADIYETAGKLAEENPGRSPDEIARYIISEKVESVVLSCRAK